jgi:surfeit locus 1 family protein
MSRLALPLTAFLATLILLGLGTWQMQRLAWKEGLIADREAGLSKAPTALPPLSVGDGEAEDYDFRTVVVEGVFRHDLEQIYGAEARNGVLGVHLLTPLVPDNGPAILIDRGWIPIVHVDPDTRFEGQLEGEVEIRGIARYRADDQPGLFTPENEPENNLWYSYDLEEMADALLIELSPIVIEADGTPNPGGFPIGGGTKITLTNNHLQYAITWYGLAIALIGVYIVFRRQQRARPEASA